MHHMFQLIDTHGHVQFNAFKDDGHAVLKKTLAEGVWVIMPGTQIDTSRRAVEYAQLYREGVYAAVGLHPIHLEDIEVDSSEVGTLAKFHTRKEEYRREAYEELLKSNPSTGSGRGKVVAIGEIGLDYWRVPEGEQAAEAYKLIQKDVFVQQLDLALDYNLPVIVHCRKAHDDILEILESHSITKNIQPPGVIHCYTGNHNQLHAFLALGFYIGVNGIIWKMNLKRVLEETPLDRILLETDSPYLTPPSLGDARNEPLNVRAVAEKIAEIKGVSVEEVARQTTENARKIFRI
jgi:TatD DNase family protein